MRRHRPFYGICELIYRTRTDCDTILFYILDAHYTILIHLSKKNILKHHIYKKQN